MAWQPTVWRRSSTRPVWTYVTSQSINLSSLICRCLPGSRNTERALMLSVHCCWCCNTGTADVSWLVVGCVVVMDQVATQCRFGCLQLIYIMLDGDQIQATFNRSSLQSRLFSLQKSLTRLGSVSANLHQHQNFSRKWSGIWIAKLIQIWMSVWSLPKCCGLIILSVSVILPGVVKISRWLWEMLVIGSIKENGKEIRNLYLRPEPNKKLISSFDW